jgi:hypothetical protein
MSSSVQSGSYVIYSYINVGKQCHSGTGKVHGTRWIVLVGAWGTITPTFMLELPL